MSRLAVAALLPLAVAGCDLFVETDPAPVDQESARYLVTFEATWSAATHPEMFPDGAHFSRLTGAAHAPDVSLATQGDVASDGIRDMAERGVTATLRAEVEALGDAAAYVEGEALGAVPGTVVLEVEVTQGRPEVALFTMLAPSPDWFVGVSGLDLRLGDGWIDRLEAPLGVLDAGTDDGATYTAADAPRADRAPIAPVDYAPLTASHVGTLTFTRLE